MSVTIKDIAEKAGVSFSTVSKALRDSPLVQEKTKLKILEIAKEMGYQPNIAARRLVSKKSWTIGVVWPSIERVATSALITRINKELADHSYTTLLSINQTKLAIDTFIRLQMDAILVFYDREAEAIETASSSYNVPILYYGVDGLTPFTTIDTIRSRAVELAVDHLASLGHQRIAYVGHVNYTDPLQTEKVNSFQMELTKRNLPLTSESILPINSLDTHEGYAVTKKLLVSTLRPTAVISGSYDLTKGIFRAANELKVKIPEHLSVVSYDQIPQMEEFDVPVTSVGVPLDTIVATIVQTLLEMIDNQDGVDSIHLEPVLVERPSSGPPSL